MFLIWLSVQWINNKFLCKSTCLDIDYDPLKRHALGLVPLVESPTDYYPVSIVYAISQNPSDPKYTTLESGVAMSEFVCSVWTEGRFVWKQCWVLKYSSSCGRGNCHTRKILRARQECEDSSRRSGTPLPREKPQPQFRQQHVSLEVATSLRASSRIWASPARTRERGAAPTPPPPPPHGTSAFASSSHVPLARLLLMPNGELARRLQSWSRRLGHFEF